VNNHLDLIDNFEFMQWCDSQPQDAVKMRAAFILVRQDGLTVRQAARRLKITGAAVYARAAGYVKLCDRYLKESK